MSDPNYDISNISKGTLHILYDNYGRRNNIDIDEILQENMSDYQWNKFQEVILKRDQMERERAQRQKDYVKKMSKMKKRERKAYRKNARKKREVKSVKKRRRQMDAEDRELV